MDVTLARELFDYNPDTGELRWKPRPASDFRAEAQARTWNTIHAGKVAGTKTHFGYWQIRFGGRGYFAHRIAWLITHGEWPKLSIDHIDHDRLNNRLANLRDVTAIENFHNRRRLGTNTSGFTGVVWHVRNKKWMAAIRSNGRTMHLGYFKAPEEAIAKPSLDVGSGWSKAPAP